LDRWKLPALVNRLRWVVREGGHPPRHCVSASAASGISWAVEFGLERAGLELLLESETVTFNIERNRMMQQAVEDGAGDDGIAKDLAPGAHSDCW
jgi:hypothetical protein